MSVLASAKLVPNLFAKDISRAATRDGFGRGLVEAGKKNEAVVTLCADLTESTRVLEFKQAFPDRFIQMGVAEQSLAAIASGMALAGKIPFIASYAAFSPGRNWEQIRTTGCLQNVNLKIVGNHAGVSVGPDGATHQMTEDIALMRVLPNMMVLSPCDAIEAEKATIAAATIDGPVYIRLSREASPTFTTKKTPFEVGKAQVLTKGDDVAIIATGPLVYEALKAARDLKKMEIDARVINCATIKPLDSETIVKAAKECGAIVTLEEAQIAGGFGGAICELLAEEFPVPVIRLGLHDEFGQSGTAAELLEHYQLTAPWIVKAAKEVIKKSLKR
ncbi:MAG: transketolase C-terminal domain-containing protein [Patescibacteria group bacterium]